MATLPTQKCKCGAAVVYIRSARGRSMPHEPRPVTITTLAGELVMGWLKHTCAPVDAHELLDGRVAMTVAGLTKAADLIEEPKGDEHEQRSHSEHGTAQRGDQPEREGGNLL